jgi:hypothetical protein
MKKLITIVMLMGCGPNGPQPICVTGCGMGFYGTYPDQEETWSCQDLTRAETRWIDTFTEFVKDPRFSTPDAMCSIFAGWQLWTYPNAQSWINRNGESVAGQTLCDYGVVQVGTDTISKSAYAHELVHIIQGCEGTAPYEKDVVHSNWVKDGIYHAIDIYQGF